MYPADVNLTAEESEIVFRIRQLVGDEKEVFVDDIQSTAGCSTIVASGTLYQLEEPKGYPLEIFLNNTEITTSGAIIAAVVGYKYIKFNSSILIGNQQLTVVYNHFKHSDLEIIATYDTSALTYLTRDCNLSVEQIGVDLLVLATAYILIIKDLIKYTESAVNLGDSDSRFDASVRPRHLKDLLDLITVQLKTKLESRLCCAMYSVPPFRVE